MLFDSASTGTATVVVHGNRRKKEVFRVLRFLRLNSILYSMAPPQQGCTVAVSVGDTMLRDPKLIHLARKLGLVSRSDRSDYDLIVVGGGPAGLSAAVNAAAHFLNRVLVIENVAPGGAAGTASNRIDNYLGFPDGVEADDLAQRAMKHALNQKIHWMPACTATKLESFSPALPTMASFHQVTVQTDDGKSTVYTAPLVLAACGAAPRRQGGIDERVYEGQGVYYMALPSDAKTVRARDKIAIVGAGDTAGRAALMFAKAGADVTMIIRNKLDKDMLPRLVKQIKAEKKRITVREKSNISQYQGSDGRLTSVVINNEGRPLDVDSVYVLIGAVPDTKWLETAGVQVKRHKKEDKTGYVATGADVKVEADKKKDKTGYVATGADVKVEADKKVPLPLGTSIPGVFAAGDVRYGAVRRISMAAGDGAAAALSMHNYLKNHPDIPAAQDDPVSAYYA